MDEAEWRAKAACRDGADTSLFFPVTDEEAGPAKAVCRTCAVRQQCLEYALKTRQDDGVWGGKTEAERRKIRRERHARFRL